MPQYDAGTLIKIGNLRARYFAGEQIEVYELAKINWPSPDGDIYYSTTQLDELDELANRPAVSPIEARLIPDAIPNYFLPLTFGGAIGDEEVELTFWDADGAISDLLATHGEGSKVVVYFYFPQEDLLLTMWEGHLRLEDEAEPERIRLKAVQGYRSAETLVPHRAHWQECQAIFGGVFDTQAEIDEHFDCPYNRQIMGGTTGNLNGMVPFTSCPRKTQSDCETRLGVSGRYMLSHRTVQAVIANDQTSGPRIFSVSQGNETNLKEAVRVVMGTRRIRNMKVMAFAKDLNNNTPDRGFFRALYEACEGPIDQFSNVIVTVGGVSQAAQPIHYEYRQGNSPEFPVSNLTSHGYSGTAYLRYTFGWVDPRTIEPNDASAQAVTGGLTNIRVYTDAETYTQIKTSNRVWQIARILCDKRWGFGFDYADLEIDSWIEAAEWAAETVRFTDPDGTNWDHVRSDSHVELIAKKVQQQIDDMCVAGRLSRPFLFNGKIHIVPLKALTEEELADCPVFTDEGDEPNIIVEGQDVERSTLRISRLSDLDLPNRIEPTYDDAAEGYLETAGQPVEDIDQQLRAGRVVGTAARKINQKQYSLLGVVAKAQSHKVAWSLLDLGPCDEGGLMNNLRLKFKIWFADALELHPYKVIKVESTRLTRYGFEYFRIRPEGLSRGDDLQYEVECQAYPVDYMDTFETVLSTLPGPPDPPEPPTEPSPIPGDPQFPQPTELPQVLAATYEEGFFRITLSPS